MPRVSICDTNKTFEVNEGEILYDALFDRGEDLPHGCLAGSCGACRVEILSGKENLSEAGVVEKNTIESIKDEYKKKCGDQSIDEKTIRLSCRVKVKGDVEFKPFK